MTATSETSEKYVIYDCGGIFNNRGRLAYMRQDEYEHWEEVSQSDRDWPILKEKYATVARGLTLEQADGMLKLLAEET
jgi:hypothetical protein